MSDNLKLSDLKVDAESDKIGSDREEEERLKRVKELQENIGELEKLIPKHRPEPARSVPSNKLGARKHASFKSVSTAPSINLTPRGRTMVPVAYPTVQDLSSSVSVAPGVRFNNCAVYLLDRSTQPKCTGDQAGSGGGVRSGTVNGEVKPVDGCRSVRVEGKRVVRDGDACTMNSGNNPGIYVTVPATSPAPPRTAILSSNPPICTTFPKDAPEGAERARPPKTTDGSATGETKNLFGLPGPSTQLEKAEAIIRQESVDGNGALRRDLMPLRKTAGPSFVARDVAAEDTVKKMRQHTGNSLIIALLGPVFGTPGAATRLLGGSENLVTAGNEVGAAAMGVAWSIGGVPGRKIISVAPRVISKTVVTEARSSGGVRVTGRPAEVLKNSPTPLGGNRATFAADEIRFSQSSVSYNKVDRVTGKTYTYDDLVTSMRDKGWQGDPVDLVRMPDGKLTSMDNTRISAAREAGIKVQGVERSYGEALTPEIQNARGWSDYNTWGEAITARINSQSKNFSTENPYGSPQPPRIKGKK